MKVCTFCKQTALDEATECPHCGQRVIDPNAPNNGADRQVASQSFSSAAPDAGASNAVRMAANRDMRVGGIWFLGGIIVTFVTYNAASGGGSYVVAWGAIIFGGIQFFRGLIASKS